MDQFYTCDGMLSVKNFRPSRSCFIDGPIKDVWFSETKGCSHEKYTRLTRSLVQMCAIDLRPLSITEGDGFRYYYKKL